MKPRTYQPIFLNFLLGLLALVPLAEADTRHSNSGGTIDTHHPNWMRWVPDDVKLNELSLPGTHDTMSLYGGGLVETQSLDLSEQLDAGIRVLDIRARHIEDVFAIHHGSVFQNAFFGDVLIACNTFLNANPTETILLRLSANGVPDEQDVTRTYEETFLYYRDSYNGRKFWRDVQTNPNPTLGDVRGKIVLIEGFSCSFCGINSGRLEQQDEWNLNTAFDIPDKWEDVVNFWNNYVDPDLSNTPDPSDNDIFYSNHLSASSDNGGVWPIDVADGVLGIDGINKSALRFLFELNQTRTTGIVMMDFPGEALIDIIIAHNMKHAADTSLMSDDFDDIFDNVSYSARDTTDEGARQHLVEMDRFLHHILPNQFWSLLVSGTQGGENWGYSVDHIELTEQSPWNDGYTHVALGATSRDTIVSSSQLSSFLTESTLRTLGGNAYQRAVSLQTMLRNQFPGMRWNTLVKKAPGGFENWAYLLRPAVSFSSGWMTDDGDDYHYVAWANSVTDYPPIVDHGGPYVVGEGVNLTLNAGRSRDPEGTDLLFRWDYTGDKNWDTSSSKDPTLTLRFPKDPGQAVRLLVSDKTHEIEVDVPITVTNIPPRISLGADITVLTNTVFSRAASIIDPGDDDWKVRVDYDDGLGFQTINLNNKAFTLSHSYNQPRAYQVAVWFDDGQANVTNYLTVDVFEPGPPNMLTFEGPTTDIPEGSSVTVRGTFYHADWTPDWAIIVNWWDDSGIEQGGDATSTVTSIGPDTWEFTATHTFADDRDSTPRRVVASLIYIPDIIHVVDAMDMPLTVANVAPSNLSSSGGTVPEGSPFIATVNFEDPGADTWIAVIDYGDGTRDTNNVAGLQVQLNHVYPNAGDYVAVVSITDDEGDGDNISIPVEITNVEAMVGPLKANPFTIPEGDSTLVTGAIESSALDYDTLVTTVDWGDGSPPATPKYSESTATSRLFSASHFYRDNGKYTIQATVTDEEGSSHSAVIPIQVNNVDPIIQLKSRDAVASGSPFRYFGHITDPGADSWTGRVFFGDSKVWEPLKIVKSSFSWNHIFPSNNVYKVTVEITDKDGGATSGSMNVMVGLPELSIHQISPGKIQLHWPTPPFPFILQEKPDANAKVWSDVLDPIAASKGTNFVTPKKLISEEYFRLVLP